MSSEKINFDGMAWARADVEGLEVVGTVLSKRHDFLDDEGRKASIVLPTGTFKDAIHPDEKSEQRVSLRSWISDSPELSTAHYRVSSVDVELEVSESLSAPETLFGQAINAYELVGKRAADSNSKTVETYNLHLLRVLERWEEVVRWVTNSSALGSPDWVTRVHSPRLHFMRILRAHDRADFWGAGGHIAARRATRIDDAAWMQIGTVLTSGQRPPIWFRYLDDLHHRFVKSDYVGTLLSCAIACETVAREVFWNVAGQTANGSARELVDRVAIQNILQRWTGITGLDKEKTHIHQIHKIFDKRNTLVHVGGTEALDEGGTEGLAKAAREFVLSADEWLFVALGRDNPRLWRKPQLHVRAGET